MKFIVKPVTADKSSSWYKQLWEAVELKYEPALEERFAKEVTQMELLRVSLVFWLVLSSFILGLLNLLLGRRGSDSVSVMHNLDIFSIIVAILLLYCFFVRLYILRLVKRNATIARPYRILTTVIECSLPTIYSILLSVRLENVFVLFTPILLLYFLFIVVSTLRLNFWLSVLTGAVCAIEYYFIAKYIVSMNGVDVISPVLTSPALIVGRASVLMMCGVAAGFVALEIKKRIVKIFRVIGERNMIRQIFGQQVSPEIVNEIIEKKEEIATRRQFVAVMFLDIRDFTPFVQRKTPEEVLEYQNQLFGTMVEIVNRHKGIINQFLGDGFMATFGAPIAYGNECQRVVDAAIEIIDRTQIACEKGIIPRTRLGIGIHCGEAVTGHIGTELRKQFSIIGNVVIQASRIEQLNKEFKSQLLISKEVFDKIKALDGESLGEVMLKGEDKPMEIMRIR